MATRISTCSAIGLRNVLAICFVIAVFGMSAGHADAQVLVDRISLHEQSSGEGYVLRLHTSEHVPVYGMPQIVGDELIWKIHQAQLGSGFQQDEMHGPVASAQIEQRENELEVRLTLNGEREIEADAYRDGASDDLLMALNYEGAPRAQGLASSGSGSVSRSGDRWRLDTIVLDAGHGGRDGGTSGYGHHEKDVVLDITRKVGEYVEENLGINVVYTREDDRFISLRDRGRIANEAGAKLFVSIHANAAANRAAHGSETFFLGMHRSESARRVMERENSVISYEENPEQYDDLSESMLIQQALTQSAYMRQSERFAALIENQFENRINRNSRGVKQAGFQVLWEASMPAVLIEVGFLSNRNDAQFITSEQGKAYIASGIYRAIRDFKVQYERGLSLSQSDEE